MSSPSPAPEGAPIPDWKTGSQQSDHVFTVGQLLTAACTAGVLDQAQLAAAQQELAGELDQDVAAAAPRLIASGRFTQFQIDTLTQTPELPLVYNEYVVLDKLGAGGMATVYLARRQTGEILALKVVDQPDPRFDLEIRASARLSHPHILHVYDRGQAHGLDFLVMEYVDGPCLGDLLEEKGRFSVDEALDLITQAAVGLAHIHEQQIVHRDLKPHNMMLTSEGQLKLLDFGLARFELRPSSYSVGRSAEERLTAKDEIVGTPAYTAPEQIMDARSASFEADVYSLGCTLYCLLVGSPPYMDANPMQVIHSQIKEPVPSLHDHRGDIPTSVQALLMKMMAKRPDQRYGSGAELLADLERLKQGESLAAEAEPAAAAARAAQVRRKQVRYALVFGALLVLALAAGYLANS